MENSRDNQISNSFSALADAAEEAEMHNASAASLEDQRNPFLRQPLIWIDLEMSGLDVDNDTILQIACILTDGSLERIIKGEEIVINQPDSVLEGMNDWCIQHHGRSGLTQAVRDSKISLESAEERVLQFIRKHIPNPRIGIIAGNSVHVDVAFLRRHMPRLLNYVHYRIVDVSSIGELCRRWYPKDYSRGPKKINEHTAMSDIQESIEQLRYYKKTIFK